MLTRPAGTGAPNPGTVFGASLHRELQLLGRCRITPAQALNAATAAAARVLNLADRGHTAPGQRADLMLVTTWQWLNRTGREPADLPPPGGAR